MKYNVIIMPTADKDLDGLAQVDRDRILRKIIGLTNDLAGDVKRLTNFSPEYRLRVGDYRVLFDVEMDRAIILRVVHRGKVY